MQIQPTASPIPRIEERQPRAVEQPGGGTPPPAPAPAAAESGAEPARKELSDAVRKINESTLGTSQGLEFSIDEDSKEIVVKVIDQDTKEVLRQMPSKEALEIAKSLDKMRGLLLNQTA
jgi:flagellar protein FlaG